jgi:DNA invertase Pin-like site-specific DNA recombinase
MSTDHQKYSTENQLDTIRRYAEQRGFEIMRVFEDSGRSGLKIDGRDGLQALMHDVQSGFTNVQQYFRGLVLIFRLPGVTNS